MQDHTFILDKFISDLYLRRSYFKNTLIVVPSARVGSYILGSLATKLKIFNSPSILSLDNFILNFEPIQKDINKYKKDDLLILFYIYSKLQHLRSKYLKPNSIDKIYQLFSFMDQSLLDSTIFSKIKDLLSDSAFHSDSGINYMIEKTSDIESLYSGFISLPIKTSSFIKKIAIDSFIKYLEINPNILNQYYSSIYIVSDLYPSYYNKLLSILEKKDNVFFIKDDQSNLLSFDIDNSEESSTKLTTKNNKIKAYFFNSFIQESFFITKKISYLISKGIPPSSIGVVLLNEKKYTPVLKELFRTYKIPSNFTSATSVKNSKLSTWISESLMFNSEKDDTNAFLYKFLTSSLSIAIVAYNNQSLFHNDSTSYSLEEFFTKYTIKDSYLVLSNIYSTYLTNKYHTPLNDKASSLYKLVEPLLSIIFGIDTKTKSYLDFYKKLDSFYKAIEPYISIVYKNDPYSLKVLDSFRSFIDYLKELNHLKISKDNHFSLTIADINFLFSEYINKSLYWDPGSSLKGVQVLKLPETSYFPFRFTFVLGCSEQNDFSFSEGLFPSFIETRLNLNKNQELKDLNLKLFSLLFKNTSKIELSFSQDELLYFNPHKYLQILNYKHLIDYINLKDLKIYDNDIINNIINFYDNNNLSNTVSNSTTPIKITDFFIKKHSVSKTSLQNPINHLSATLIQNLIDCPYKFILAKYIPFYRYPTSQLLSLDSGSLIHKVLEEYVKGIHTVKKEERRTYILSLLEKFSFSSFKNTDLYFHIKNFSLNKILDFLEKIEEISDPNLINSKTEFKIPAFNIKLSNLDISLEGIIDRLDTLHFLDTNIYLVTDYKSSDNSIPTLKDTKSGKACQLLIYTHALSNQVISGYWDIKKGEWKVHLCSQSLSSTLFSKKKKIENNTLDFLLLKPSTAVVETSYQNLIDNIEQRIQSIKEHDCFYMDLGSCEKCHFSKICKNTDI